MTKKIDRRNFMETSLKVIAGAGLYSVAEPLVRPALASKRPHHIANPAPIVVVKNGRASTMVRKAVESLGGIGKFVAKGETVVIKPNMSWDRAPAYAANTNPFLVQEMVNLCLEAGAAKIKIFDRPCNDPRRSYKNSGFDRVFKHLRNPRVEFSHIDERRFVYTKIPQGKNLKEFFFYKDALEADCIINMPIAKHHSLTTLTLSMKNYMGLLGGQRAVIHQDIDQNLADISTLIKARLILTDCTRILVANGPQGGDIKDVRRPNTIVAGSDPVAVDSYCCRFFSVSPSRIGYLSKAYKMGLGEMDLSRVPTTVLDLS